MLEELTPWEPRTRVTSCVEIDDLSISFMRTIRVPDNENLNALPPSLGEFPLFKTDDYADKLPASMAEKGGIFIPMYQREALWIDFESEKRYAIKIFTGNVNAISGESQVPDAASALRRRELLHKRKPIQDYVVTPCQPWIDGVAIEPGKVRQFVAMPVGSGHSVEAQMTGQESTAGLQFEITRLDVDIPGEKERSIAITVATLNGKSISVKLSSHDLVYDVKQIIEEIEGIPVDQERLIFSKEQLEDGRLLMDYGLGEGSLLHLVLKLRGGGPSPSLPPKPETEKAEMTLAAGGAIRQSIVAIPGRQFRKTITIAFNLQILNSASFSAVTGLAPPPTPASAAVYAELGLPFYYLHEESSLVSGGFLGLKSIAQIDGTPDKAMKNLSIIDVKTGEPVVNCNGRNSEAKKPRGDAAGPKLGRVGLLDPRGPRTELQFTWEMGCDARVLVERYAVSQAKK
ncbi:integral membrane [Fusarium acutatum]|uniref:Integral membrane n=1 Tax=Fusarium acutatum TaxID=78861 RepID=A0A8H4NF37_9HYPO|nr:integral membrane [Fusarium acutatum]